MNLILVSAITYPGQGQPVVGNGSRRVYVPRTVEVLLDVTPDDAETLIGEGYIALSLPALFGSGSPSAEAVEGQSYFDTTDDYAPYVYHGGAWEQSGGGSSAVTSITAGEGVQVDQPTGDVTITVGVPQNALVAGGAAGDIAVAGIELGDRLDQVICYVYTAGVTTDVLDLTSEFMITADGTINNTGGTVTTGNKLLVNWTKLT
jgi:hypothetical protein